MGIRTSFSPMGTFGKKLPPGYIELEYLESTGTQYIDTGLLCNYSYIIDLDIATLKAKGIGFQSFFGYAQTSSKNYKLSAYVGQNNNLAAYIGNDAAVTTPNDVATPGSKHSIRITEKCFYVDNILYSDSAPVLQAGNGNMYLFARNGSFNSGSFRIYTFKVKLNNKLVLNFIPALDPTGRPCMYDLVGQKPYYNQGTGEFLWGAKLPRGYTSVSAIYAPGNYNSGVMKPGGSYPQFTHYIDTGYSPTNLTRVDVNATFVTSGSMGCSTWDNHDWVQGKKRFHIASSNNQWSYGLFDSNVISGGSFTPGTNYNITVDAKNSKVVINGTQLQVAHTSNDMAGIASFCLFVRKDLDGIFEYAHDMYLYSCKIYEDDKLVRIYAPAHRDSDGVNGLYELKTRTFISNARGAANFATLQ